MTRTPASNVTVSIVIPFLNARPYIEETIESVRRQTLESWELILVDDGSDDGSGEVAKTYAAAEPERISYMDHPGHANLGISASRNAGWSRAVGKYVLSVDADDVLLAHCLEALSDGLERHPRAAAAQGRCVYWHSWLAGPASADRDVVHVYPYPTERTVSPPALAEGPLIGTFPWPCMCATLYRRSSVPEGGPFDPAFRTLFEDLVAYLKVALFEDVYVTKAIVALYRQHPVSVTGSASREDHDRLRAEMLGWTESYLRTRPIGDRRPARWLRFAQLLNRRPLLARVRRTALRMGRLVRGYPAELVESPPVPVPELAGKVGALSHERGGPGGRSRTGGDPGE
jgi:glycosyltransferase involved in cell wall biosynthesis